MSREYDITSPYDDEFLTYNYNDNRYVLNESYAKIAVGDSNADEKVGGQDNFLWTLNHMSKAIYESFRFYLDSKFYDKLSYYLGHSKHNRKVIAKALADILIYTDEDGGLYTAYSAGINFNEMAKIDFTLINYIGNMANTIIVNGGLAHRVIPFDYDRLTTLYNTKVELLDYMDSKGYLDKNDYLGDDLENDIPKSNKYQIARNGTNQYVLYEFNQWANIMSKKGVEW